MKYRLKILITLCLLTCMILAGSASAAVNSGLTALATALNQEEPAPAADIQGIRPFTERDQDDSSQPLPMEDALFQWEGYYADPTYYEVSQFGESNPSMDLYMHVINNTDRTLTLWFQDTDIDGISVVSTGIFSIAPHTDTGEESEEYCLIITDSDNVEGTSAAILFGEILTTTLVLKDSDTSEDLYSKEVTIDLRDLDREETIYEPITTAAPEPETTSAPKVTYRSLSEGDSGEDVKRLQQKLIELGYLNDVADGAFGPRTADAVREFNEQNDLGSYSTAYIDTQELLFSGNALPYTEPWVPLEIGSWFKWDAIPEVNTFFFRIEVTNKSRTRTIKGYELSAYTTNLWGERIADDPVYTITVTQRVGPGETVYSNSSFNLGYYASVNTVWVAVSKIVFTDGEVRENNVLEYYSCELLK